MESFSNDNLDQLDFLNNQFKNISNKNHLIQSDNLILNNSSNKQSVESILIIDTETTGLDENDDEVIEIAANTKVRVMRSTVVNVINKK